MKLIFRRAAEKALDKIPADRRRQLLSRLKDMAADPASRAFDIKPLAGSNMLRLRVGEYRLLFAVDAEQGIMIIDSIRMRGDVYKR